jgi:membrane associated rhomboid family serine protease
MAVPVLTIPIVLVISVVLVSVLAWLFEPLKRFLILNPYRVRKSLQLHRLLTAGWIHGDITHLGFNMLSLWFFADQTMRGLGALRFVVLYVSAVVVAFVPTTLRHMSHPQYSTLGASGAVAAVMFSAIFLYPNMKLQLLLVPFPLPGIVFGLGYLAYSAWHAYRGGQNINHDAHFFGALYGALLTYAFEPTRVERAVLAMLRSLRS